MAGSTHSSGVGQHGEQSTALLLAAIAMAGYGTYRALYIPAMLVGRPSLPLLVGFLLQALFGIIAGVAVWRGVPWARLVIALLGASVAATAMVEGFVLGIVPYLRALLEAVVGILVTFLIITYVKVRPV